MAAQSLATRPTCEHAAARQELVAYADLLVDIAREDLARGQNETGRSVLANARYALDLALDFVPGASLAKDITSLVTGINPITRETLTQLERGVIVATVIFPGSLKGSFKGLRLVADRLQGIVVRSAKSSETARRALEAVRHALAVDAKYGEHVVSAMRFPDVQAAVARWGTSAGGFSQLVMHTVGKAAETRRLSSLEKRAGLTDGMLAGFINDPTAEAIRRSMLELDKVATKIMRTASPIAEENGHRWVMKGLKPGKPDDGLAVVEKFGKIQSVMPHSAKGLI